MHLNKKRFKTVEINFVFEGREFYISKTKNGWHLDDILILTVGKNKRVNSKDFTTYEEVESYLEQTHPEFFDSVK